MDNETKDARIASLEAALRAVAADAPTSEPEEPDFSIMDGERYAWACGTADSYRVGLIARDALSGGTAALDATVAKAVAARDEAWTRTIRAAFSGVGVNETPAEPTPEVAQSMRRQVGEHLLALQRTAVEAEQARIRAAVEGLSARSVTGNVVATQDVLAAIGGAS